VALDGVFREHWARVLATLVGILGDIELAEDAAQEAFAIAAERWPRDGEPDNPVGWLISTARNRAIDTFADDGLELDHYRYFHSARAELLRRAGRDDEARHAYRRALELAQTDAERRSLNDQLSQLSSG